ncbi:hypothetical protein [Phenylobacterium sp.]|uniref:hypothetical protein n=1 Tax=Phenylobacterium sp. TaxID=1871053 RepID=UPI00391C6E05
MRRYLQPAILLLLGLGVWAAQDVLPWPNVGFAAMLVYAVGTAWWAVAAATAPAPLLRHGLAAWLPTLPLVAVFAWIEARTGFDGPGAIVAMTLLPLLIVTLVASAIASMVLGLRNA